MRACARKKAKSTNAQKLCKQRAAKPSSELARRGSTRAAAVMTQGTVAELKESESNTAVLRRRRDGRTRKTHKDKKRRRATLTRTARTRTC